MTCTALIRQESVRRIEQDRCGRDVGLEGYGSSEDGLVDQQ